MVKLILPFFPDENWMRLKLLPFRVSFILLSEKRLSPSGTPAKRVIASEAVFVGMAEKPISPGKIKPDVPVPGCFSGG